MSDNAKIKTLDDLALCLCNQKAAGKKIVLAHGVFDLLHIGHIRHLEQAKKLGDVLVVTLTRDRDVNKGPHRPAFPQELRAEMIAALAAVDYVAINAWPMAVETIKLLQPHIYAKGPDYKQAAEDITGGIALEAEAVRAVGGEIQITEDITFSSSQLLNTFLSPFSEEVNRYLSDFRRRHSSDEVLSWLNKAAELRPVVLGEAIIDEYLFCDSIGKSTKDPVLAVLQRTIEAYPGGSLAIANHLAGLCPEVRLLTQLGETERREDFVRQVLRPNVEATFLTKANSPTIHKRRVVDQYSGNKLVEVYVMNDEPTNGADAQALQAAVMQHIENSDLMVVADYGHGFLTSAAIAALCENAPFLAVNVQSNAGNRGFNPVSKYGRANYVCVANHEVDIETRQRGGNVRSQILEIVHRIACPRFTVTMGKFGSLHYDINTGFCQAPALATRVVDRVGAGDAVLAVTSLLARVSAPPDVIAFVGNAAGAQAVAQLGNRSTLDRIALSKHIVTLLK